MHFHISKYHVSNKSTFAMWKLHGLLDFVVGGRWAWVEGYDCWMVWWISKWGHRRMDGWQTPSRTWTQARTRTPPRTRTKARPRTSTRSWTPSWTRTKATPTSQASPSALQDYIWKRNCHQEPLMPTFHEHDLRPRTKESPQEESDLWPMGLYASEFFSSIRIY